MRDQHFRQEGVRRVTDSAPRTVYAFDMPRVLTDTDLALLEGLPAATDIARILGQQAHLLAEHKRLLRYLTNLVAGEPEDEMSAPTPEYGEIVMEVWHALNEQGVDTYVSGLTAAQVTSISAEFAEQTGVYDETGVVAVLWAMEGRLKPSQLILEEADVAGFAKPMGLRTENFHGEVEH